ncbi:MAG: ArnT family glycosyltransferase [Candidatus Electrothrix sp. YB6]
MAGTVLGATLVSLLLLAFTPPFSRDALIHHLQIPKLYLQHGGMYEIPELVFSYYPMNLDLLYMGALYFGSDILPKYIHMAFGLATALLLYLHLKKRLSSAYGILGAAFFLSIPIIVKLSITVYVDLGLVFFTTASLLLLFRWLETKKVRILLAAGVCCGLCIGTKYNGLLVLFILTFMVPVLFIRSQEQREKAALPAVKAAVLFCFATLLAASPWMIRNALWTGNPIYPLYNGFFSRTAASAEQQDQQTGTQAEEAGETDGKKKSSNVRGVFARRYVLYGENIWQLLLLPARIFFQGQDGDPRYFDGRLNPFLLLLPLVLLFYLQKTAPKVRLEQLAMLTFCLLYFLYAFNTGVLRIRYLVPMVPFLVILAMYGLRNVELLAARHVKQAHAVKLVLLLPVILLFAWNGRYIWQQFKEVDPFSYITGRLDRDAYLTERLQEYPVLQYANSNLPDSAEVLCLFLGWRGYHLDRPHLFDQHGNRELLLARLQQPGMTADGIVQYLKEKKITHLLIRADLLAQWLNTEDRETGELWKQLNRKHLTMLYTHLYYILYQIDFG